MNATNESLQRQSTRPWMPGGSGLTLLIAAAMWCLPGESEAEDWPIFLGPTRNAQTTESLHLPWPADGPAVLWTAVLHDTYAAPTIADGGVFVFDREGDRARLSRLDAADGKEEWRSEYPTQYVDQFDFGGGPRAAPLFDPAARDAEGRGSRNRVYAFGVDGRLRCHDADSGEVLWEVDSESSFGVVQNFFGVGASPVLHGDLLLVSIGGSPPGDWNNHEGRIEPNGTGLVAFDKLTGEVRYRALNDLASYSSPVIVRLGGKQRLVTFARSGLWVLDPDNGTVLADFPWRAKKIYSVNASMPVVRGDEIFISESYEKGGALLRWVEKAGSRPRLETVWTDARVSREQKMATHWNTPVLVDGVLYGSHGEKSGSAELRAVEWATGEVHWKQRGFRRASVLAAEDHLVVLGEYGDLAVVKATPDGYSEVQRVRLTEDRNGESAPLLRYPAWNAPILVDGVLYVAGADRLVALRLTRDKPADSAGSP